MGIDDRYTAYCFNEAVFLWGIYVEGELRSAGEGAKTKKQAEQKVKMRSRQILDPPEKEFSKYEAPAVGAAPQQKAIPQKVQTGRFRDPAELFRK